jgi:hypothetical protein
MKKRTKQIKVVLQPEISAAMDLDTWMWWLNQEWYFNMDKLHRKREEWCLKNHSHP